MMPGFHLCVESRVETCQDPQIWLGVQLQHLLFVLLSDLLLEGQQPAEMVESQPSDEVSGVPQQQRRTLWGGYRPAPVQQLQDVHCGCKQSI